MGEMDERQDVRPSSSDDGDVVHPMDEAGESSDEEASVVVGVSNGTYFASCSLIYSDILRADFETILSSETVTDEEAVQAYLSLDKDLDSISQMLDLMDRRSDDLKGRILSLLNDMKTPLDHD